VHPVVVGSQGVWLFRRRSDLWPLRTKFLESLNTDGADCALTMLPPLQKPVKAERIHQIIRDRKLNVAAASTAGMSLSNALLRNLVTFLYQPKFDLKTQYDGRI
jgi:hypothetical protein